MKSIIYWHPWLYRLAMRAIYGREYKERYRIIAREAGNMEVLDLCCGDCKLSEYVVGYKGIDLNDNFVRSARMRGINAIKMDIMKEGISKAECIVMQDSLYQFIPNHEKIIKKILKSSKKAIISEAGISLGQSRNPIISIIAKKLTNTSKHHPQRFTKKQLYSIYKKFNAKKIIDTGKDLTAIFE